MNDKEAQPTINPYTCPRCGKHNIETSTGTWTLDITINTAYSNQPAGTPGTIGPLRFKSQQFNRCLNCGHTWHT